MSVSIELEHAIGGGTSTHSLQLHPNGKEFIAVSGACIVVSDLTDPHKQLFLRGHDDFITCVDISKSGKMIASGQIGDNSDIIIWNFEEKSILFRLAEHEFGIECLSFSSDERFLATVGTVYDKQMFIWDMTNGYIVSRVKAYPCPAECIVWGGRVLDIKRRPTSAYLLASAGGGEVVEWRMEPRDGSLVSEKYSSGTIKRDFTCLAFSPNGEYLYAGTLSGDFAVFQIRSKSLVCSVVAASGGIHCLISISSDDWNELTVGAGDGSVAVFRRHPDEKVMAGCA
eukprot:804550_1